MNVILFGKENAGKRTIFRKLERPKEPPLSQDPPQSEPPEIPGTEEAEFSIRILNIPGDGSGDEDGLVALQADTESMIATFSSNTRELPSRIVLCLEAESNVPSILSTLEGFLKLLNPFSDIITVCITKCDKKGDGWWNNQELKEKINIALSLKNVVFWESSTTAEQMKRDLLETKKGHPFPLIEDAVDGTFLARKDDRSIDPTIKLQEAEAKYKRLAEAFCPVLLTLESWDTPQGAIDGHFQLYNILMDSIDTDKELFISECGLEKDCNFREHLRRFETTMLSFFPSLLQCIEAAYPLSESTWRKYMVYQTRRSKCPHCDNWYLEGATRERKLCGPASNPVPAGYPNYLLLFEPATLEFLFVQPYHRAACKDRLVYMIPVS